MKLGLFCSCGFVFKNKLNSLLKDFKSPFIPLSKGGNLALPLEKVETNSPFEKGGKGGFWTYYICINQVFFATILIMAFLSIQNA
ncbi:MAG: hypothetical protein AAB740_01400, partial [Patescibacteria group bacterium]